MAGVIDLAAARHRYSAKKRCASADRIGASGVSGTMAAVIDDTSFQREL
jgi:hypothetical protein